MPLRCQTKRLPPPPPIYTDVESFVTTESKYFTDLGYEPDTEIKKYRAKLTISGRNSTADFDLLNVAKQWAKDRDFELKDLTTDNMVYDTALLSTKWYADDSCLSIAFTTGGFGVRIEIAFFATDPEAAQFLTDAKDIVSTFETPNSFDLEDESRLYDTGVSTNGAVPRAELKIAWNISSIADDNVNKAMELCRKWGEFFGIPMDNFKLEKRGSSLYQALAYVKKDESRYVVSCVVNLDEVQRAVASTRIIVDDLEQN